MQRADAVFEGGGVKGIGLLGALQAFEEAGFQWQNVAGTSAGAIVAALTAVGYKAAEVREIMNRRIEFNRLPDPSFLGSVPRLGPWLSLIFEHGMYRGDYFLDAMRQVLQEKLNKDRVTFRDLIMPKEPEDSDEEYEKKYKYRLRVIASDLSGSQMLVLPQHVARLGPDPDDLEVALAVRMSMSIPFFFRPVKVAAPGPRRDRHWIVDGGILSNFPIWLFDSPEGKVPPWPTIGFLLWEPGSGEPSYHHIGGLVGMIKAMVRTMSRTLDAKVLEETDLSRIVKVPTGKYNTTDFDLTEEDREWLFGSGYRAATEFLAAWSFDQYVAERLEHPAVPSHQEV